MKKYTHPQLSHTIIRQKDGSSQGKYWSYLRPNLILESSSVKSSQINVGSFYKVYSVGAEPLTILKSAQEVKSFWKKL